MSSNNFKLVVVGDGGVGKSALLITSTTNSFPSEYVPTVFDNYAVDRVIDGKPCTMALWDTAGQEDYDRLRPLSYPQTDVFLICFDVHNRDSFENIKDKWIPEIDHFCREVPRILVGCKSDLRKGRFADRCVATNEAKQLANDIQCVQYMETSSLLMEGTGTLFDIAMRVAIIAKEKRKSYKKKSFFSVLQKSKTGDGSLQILLPPVMPPAGFAPEIEIETCTIGDQWLKILHDASCTDTILILSNGQNIKTHRTVLASASTVFRKALRIETDKITYKSQISSLTSSDHPAILRIESVESTRCTSIYLSELVKPEALKHGLEFFYSGVVAFDDNPSSELLDAVREFSELFSVPYLRQICDNVESEEEYLNPSIGTYICDVVGEQMKELFLKPQLNAHPDIQFQFGETQVYAHKCLLSARNKIMSKMFDGRFVEGGNDEKMTTIDMSRDRDIDPQTFLVMLEYLYCGHAPLDQGVDPVDLLILSDRYNITRLTNLCELYITKLVDRKCVKNIERADIDVIGLLNISNLYNAPQLAKWCRHFISSNYLAFSPRPEWTQLSQDDQLHIEEHRWPPVDYLNEVAEYEKLLEKQNSTKQSKSSGSVANGCRVM